MKPTSRKTAGKPRGRPFQPGNAGKPPGTRHKITRAVEALLDGEAEALTRKAIAAALGGDTTALRLCLERLAPVRRDRPVQFTVKKISSPSDALAAVGDVIERMAEGEITPSEAAAVMSVVEAYRSAWEISDMEARLTALEERVKS